MENISDLQIGKAGEYFVCADLILRGNIAFPSEQGLPYDIVMSANNKLYKIQVKTTRGARDIPQRENPIPAYIFTVGRHGKNNRWDKYGRNEVDLFALVALDSKSIAYMANKDLPSCVTLRVPSMRGKYRDEQGQIQKNNILQMRKNGKKPKDISIEIGLKRQTVYKYLSRVSEKRKGTNDGIYFDQYTFEKCMSDLYNE